MTCTGQDSRVVSVCVGSLLSKKASSNNQETVSSQENLSITTIRFSVANDVDVALYGSEYIVPLNAVSRGILCGL